jgi:curved DNA-binding protein
MDSHAYSATYKDQSAGIASAFEPLTMSDKRRKQRQLFDCALEVTWKEPDTVSRTITVQAIDLSDSGIRVESSERIELHTEVFVRAERYGLTGTTAVRHCGRRGSKYLLGLEFRPDASAVDSGEPEEFVDYYELLQISPNAEPETIHRVFRIMASRYHPDNKETGDNEKFLLLTKAYAVLSDPSRRASYESLHRNQRAQPLPVFGLKEFAEGLEGEVNRRLGILSLLYNRRRTNPEDPGISLLEFETVMSFPREHLEFAIWFLREKEYIRTGNNSDYYIAAAGVEYLESEVPSKGILSKLLHAAQSPTTGEAANRSSVAVDDPHALALVRVR